MNKSVQALAERLKSLRASKKISQDKLSELSGVQRNTIAKIEAGSILRPHPDAIESIAVHVGSTFEFLCFGIDAVDKFDADVRAIAIKIQQLPESKRKKLLPILNSIIDI